MTAAPGIATRSISVIICAYTLDRWDQLVDAVASVGRQTLPALEIIVVIDGNPELEQRAKATFGDIAVVANRHAPGLSGARRTGTDLASGEILAFLDDDAVADPDWLEQLDAIYADPNALGAGGLIEPQWEAPPPSWFPPEFNWVVGCTYAGMPVSDGRIRNPIGANMSMRASVLARTGEFDARLGRAPGAQPLTGTAEETEFGIRALEAHPGAYWLYAPLARVRHVVPRSRTTWRYYVRRCVVEGTAKAQLSGLSGSREALRSEREYVRRALPRAVAREFAAGLRGRRGGFGRAGAIVAGLGITAAAYARGRALQLLRSGSAR